MPRDIVIGFFGHFADVALKNSGKAEYQYLSNWSRCYFDIDGITYVSTEQWLMWSKAMLFKDKKVARKIMKIVTIDDLEIEDKDWNQKMKQVKALGREVKNFDDEIWSNKRLDIMITGLYAKFSQDEALKTILLGTCHNTLAECSVRDKCWGIGLGCSNASIQDKEKWRGQNLLGKALMRVRRTLRHEKKE